MIRTHEIRLYPTPMQEALLDRWCVLASRIYNAALEERITVYRNEGRTLSYYDQCAELTDIRADGGEMAELPLLVARDAIRKLDRSYKAFFRRVKAGQTPGFPRFKAARRWRSFELLAQGNYVKDGRVRVPKLGVVRGRNLREFAGVQKALRVIRRAGKWYAQIVVDDLLTAPEKRPVVNAVGIDVGLNHFAVLSDGTKIENPRYYRKAERQLAHAQRAVSRKRKGSNRRRKACRRVERIYERIRCLRHNFIHQLSRKLVNEYDLIAVEDLQINNMVRSRFAKSILDAAWGSFTSQLAYKAESAGSRMVKVAPQYTSQDCSGCGHRQKKPLSVREHVCRGCGSVLDRDHNAAINILQKAAGRAASSPWRGSVVDDLVEAGSPI